MKFDQKKTNKAKGIKPITKVLSLVFTGKDQKGNDYDVVSCKNIVKELQEAGCFEKLSVSVTIARSRVVDEDAKGMLNFARFQKYDTETGDVEILLMGKNTEYVDFISDYVIVPRVRVGFKSTEVVSILGFEIVPAMEA